MKYVTLATTNKRKIGEAQAALKDFDIEVRPVKLDIIEIQSMDPIVIARYKAREAFRLAGKPVVVTDTSWNIPALKGFPGGYMKDVDSWFTPTDFINLMKGHKDKRISFTETIVYQDAKQTKVFAEEFLGGIVDKPRGDSEWPIEKVAEFDGFTIAERHNQGRFSHDPKDYVWYKFAKWFVKYSGLDKHV